MIVESLEYIYENLDSKNLVDFFNSPPDQDNFIFNLGGDFEGLILKRNGKGFIAAKNTIFNSTSPTAWVGKDGSGNQVEFRFKPSKYPHIVVKNFESSLNIFKDWAVMGNSSGLAFGHYLYSQTLGGHIHFGKKPKQDLIRKLDLYLAVPVLLISNPRELVLRCKTGYGKLSAIERKPYGFENRTLGSFAINKSLTTEIYVLAGLIADQHEKMASGKINKMFERKYYEGDKEYFIKNHLSFIKSEILKVAFNRFLKWGWAFYQILKFLNRVNQKRNIISSKKEILQNWNLVPSNFLRKYKIIVNSDEYLSDLKSLILENIKIYTKLDGDLLIYGVKASRSSEDFEIMVNDVLYEKLLKLLGGREIEQNHIKSGKFGVANRYKYSIGLSFKLRKKLFDNPKDKQSKIWLKKIQEVISICVV